MNKFKMKTLFSAIAGVGALGAMGAADAVYVNPNGLGQVLIYPYYTVNNKLNNVAPFTSLLSVVNSTNSAKAVKVRFVEGRNSAEVLDFNLFLSPQDVWVAGITRIGGPGGTGAGVYTPDVSCTVPKVSADPNNPTPFVNFAYSGDGAGDGLDRTHEGYVEIIEMGVVTGSTAASVTHGTGGASPACTGLSVSQVQSDITYPQGGLFGGISLINVLAGEDFTADAVALDEFRQPPTPATYDSPGSIKPDLEDVNPAEAVVINGTQVITATATLQNVDAVSAVLMHNSLMNEYVLDAVTLSGTDWVVTAPTKRYYYDSTLNVNYLFQRNFVATGACDTYSVSIFDREEFTRPGGFSPPPPAGENPRLCWEATVVSFNGKNVLGSNNRLDVSTNFEHGWARAVPASGVYPTGANSAGAPFHVLPMTEGTFIGLPVIGFAVQTFNNNVLANATGTGFVQSSYGGNFVHKYTIGTTGFQVAVP